MRVPRSRRCLGTLLAAVACFTACQPNRGAPAGAASHDALEPGAYPDAAPSRPASPPPAVPAASSEEEATEASCAPIRRAWEAKLATFVGQEHHCKQDQDCECYGGPVCPNALVDVCPAPVRADIAQALAPFDDRWWKHGCPVIWSPYGCAAACVKGRCVSVRP